MAMKMMKMKKSMAKKGMKKSMKMKSMAMKRRMAMKKTAASYKSKSRALRAVFTGKIMKSKGGLKKAALMKSKSGAACQQYFENVFENTKSNAEQKLDVSDTNSVHYFLFLVFRKTFSK